MSEAFYYLLVDLGCLSIPFLFSFHPKLNFYKKWRPFVIGTFTMLIIFVLWDMYFTSLGVWGFNNTYLTGIYIGNLPLEEILFFICIPYASVFTYHCFSIFTAGKSLSSAFLILPWIIAITCFVVGFMHYDKWYTASTHFSCGLFLLFHLLYLKSKYLKTFMLTFLVLLIPFILSNGVLTGITFWEYPFINTHPEGVADMIVWYNNAENLSIRIFSMPVDDLSYGLTMLLLVVTIYEAVSGSFNKLNESTDLTY